MCAKLLTQPLNRKGYIMYLNKDYVKSVLEFVARVNHIDFSKKTPAIGGKVANGSTRTPNHPGNPSGNASQSGLTNKRSELVNRPVDLFSPFSQIQVGIGQAHSVNRVGNALQQPDGMV